MSRRPLFKTRLMSGGIAAVVMVLSPGAASAAGAIRADTAPGVSTGTRVSFSGTTYTIDGGKRVGANLFDSFSSFSLAAGDTADWVRSAGDADTILNVINRVTGGAPSRIEGTIDTTALPRASFYFINPAGVVFGAGARLDVPGAVYFSTASALRFADGSSFSATTPKGSVLTIAAPVAFGFLGGEGRLSVDGVDPTFVSGGTKLSLSGTDVKIVGAAVKAGSIDVAAVGDQAIDLPVSGVLPSGAELTGALSILDRSRLATRPTRSADGAIELEGGAMVVMASEVVSQATPTLPGGDVTITAQSATITDGASVGATTTTGETAGDVTVTAGSLLLDGAAAKPLNTDIASYTTGAGNAATVTLNIAGQLTIKGGAVISVDDVSGNTGSAGDVKIDAGSLVLNGGAAGEGNTSIEADTSGLGNAGALNIDVAGPLSIANGVAIVAQTKGAGAAGSVTIDAAALTIQSGSFINADTFGSGNAGDVNITAASAFLTHGSVSADSATTGDWVGTGNAGQVTMNVAGSLTIKDGGSITSEATDSLGSSGSITVNAGSLLVNGAGTNGAFINASSSGAGKAGDVNIAVTSDINIYNSGQILSNALGSSNAGIVDIYSAGSLTLMNGGRIAAQTQGPGAAGAVSVNAAAISLQNGSLIDAYTFGAGNAGTISLTAGSALVDNSEIAADSVTSSGGLVGTGNAGRITLNVANTLSVKNGGYIDSEADDSIGASGYVTVNAGSLLLNGGGSNAANIDTSIDTDSYGTGQGGDVYINTIGKMILANEAFISSDTFGVGNAGNVTIFAGSLIVRGNSSGYSSSISSDSSYDSSGSVGTGNAGAVTVNVAGKLTLYNGGSITSEADDSAGASGKVSVNAGALLLAGGPSAAVTNIDSDTYSSANAGDVDVNVAGNIIMKDGGSISSDTLGIGGAGKVTVSAEKLAIDGSTSSPGSSYISSDSYSDGEGDVGTGNAGSVSVNIVGAITIRNGGFISSNADDATGAAGDVSVSARSINVNTDEFDYFTGIGSQTLGSGAGGQVFVDAQMIGIHSGGGFSTSTFGSGPAGSVVVDAGSGTIVLTNMGTLASNADAGSTGASGTIRVTAGTLSIANGGLIETNSANADPAGDITIDVAKITVGGPGSQISSQNTNTTGGGAGDIALATDPVTLSNGGSISTNALSGRAGDILLSFSAGGLLTLSGATAPGSITTTSGANSGGQITIVNPTAIIMDGGLIQALGPGNAALVHITSPIIQSSDQLNDIAVAGVLKLDSQVVDINASVIIPDIDFIDVSKVLSGQCADRRAEGRTSQLGTRSNGPYGVSPDEGPAEPLQRAEVQGCRRLAS